MSIAAVLFSYMRTMNKGFIFRVMLVVLEDGVPCL